MGARRDAPILRRAELKIEDVAFGGQGVARHDGKAVFVPFTIDGETVSAELVREKKKFTEAEVMEVMQASPHRVKPECPYFGRCGGCSYQHIDYAHQLTVKWRQVRDVLQRIGKLKAIPLRPIIPSPLAYRYRNRITVHVQDGIVGFFRRDSHRLIDIDHCPISMDEVNQALAALRSARPRDGHYTLRADAGARPIFVQANDLVAQALRELVESMFPPGQKLLVDAYCGSGFFARALLGKVERVIGIDWDRFAIEVAQKKATAQESYRAGDLESELDQILEEADGAKTVVLLDPPATGLTPIVRETILRCAPATLIYISCNPATLARDLNAFSQKFTIVSATPLDMFPQTSEIEVAVHLQAPSA